MSEKKAPRAAKSTRAAKATPAAELPPADASPIIELDAKVTIVQATVLHGVLVASLSQGQPIVLDGSRVEEIDTAILQLLTNLWRSCPQRGITCTWHGVSETLRRTAVLIGVDQDLSFPPLEPT